MMKITSSSGNPISPNIILFCGAMRTASISSSLFAGLKIFRLYFQDAFWMLFTGLHGGLHTVQDVFVHNQLPILANLDFEPVHRPRSGPLKIHTAFVITASMARTLEFILCRQPTGRAPEMGALSKNGVNALFFANNPDPKFLNIFFAHLTKCIVAGKSRLES